MTDVTESEPGISCLSFLWQVRWRHRHLKTSKWSRPAEVISAYWVLGCCLVLQHEQWDAWGILSLQLLVRYRQILQTSSVGFGNIQTSPSNQRQQAWPWAPGWGRKLKRMSSQNTIKVVMSLVIILNFDAQCIRWWTTELISLKEPAWTGDSYRTVSSNLTSPIQLEEQAGWQALQMHPGNCYGKSLFSSSAFCL